MKTLYCQLFTHEWNRGLRFSVTNALKMSPNQRTRKIPQNLFIPIRDLNPHLIHQSRAHSTHHLKLQLNRFTHFYRTMPHSPHWLQWNAQFPPPKLPLLVRETSPNLTFPPLGSPIPPSQTASWSPQPSGHNTLLQPTDRPTAPVTCCIATDHVVATISDTANDDNSLINTLASCS